MFNTSRSWYRASLEPKILWLPCYVYFPFFIWMLHMRMWTFYLSIFVIVFVGILSRKGYSIIVFYRKITNTLRGKKNISGLPWWYTKNNKNGMRD